MDYTGGGGDICVKTRFTGKSILVSHIRDGERFRAGGWLESNKRPLAGSEVPPEFALESPGTRIAILGCKLGRSESEADWQKRTAREVITHFFHAVRHGNLLVRIGDETVSADNLDRWLSDFGDANLEARAEVSLMPPAASAEIAGIGKVNLRVKIHEDDSNRSKTLVFVRDAGMMLTDKLGNMQLTASTRMVKSFPRRWRGFTAIVECLSRGGRSLLREAEAPSHDRVSPDNADEEDRAAVRAALRELGAWVHAELGKLAAPPEVEDSQNASELTKYLPLESDEGSSGNAGATMYEIAPPVKAERAPRNMGARRGKGGKAKAGIKSGEGAIVNGGGRKRDKRKKRGKRSRAASETVLQPLSDLRRLRSSLQWHDHSVKFSFDKPESPVKRIEMYAKGEMGKDEKIPIERAYHAGRRLKVRDGAVVEPDFDGVAGDRAQLEFKTIRPVNDKRVEITAVL